MSSIVLKDRKRLKDLKAFLKLNRCKSIAGVLQVESKVKFINKLARYSRTE